MKSFLLILVMSTCAMAQDEWGNYPNTLVPDKSVLVKSDAETLAGVKLSANLFPSWKQRRAMGITFRNVAKKLAQMKREGRLEGLDKSEVSVLVLNELVVDNPTAYADVGVDWDRILAFLEKLIPLILLIFGGLS